MNLTRSCSTFSLALGLTCIMMHAQQGASEIKGSTSEQPAISSPSFTADGVPSCPAEMNPRSLPEGVYRVEGNVLPPVTLKDPEATFSDEARKYARSIMKQRHLKRFEAKSLVGFTVDTNGLPQNICVLKELGHGFDRRAFDSATAYRFKPATLNGKPVPVRIAVEMTFALW
jgi:hypothetical protein